MLLLLICATPHFKALSYGLVYDDHGVIEENAYIQTTAHAADIMKGQTFSDARILDGKRPAVLLSYVIDWRLWGTQALGYHLTNLGIHLLNVMLVFLLIRRFIVLLGGSRHRLALPWGAAALFGLHPALMEAVHMPAFREDLLCAFGLLIYLLVALCSYTGERKRLWEYLLLGNFALILAVGSKETGLLGPVLLLGLHGLLRQKPTRYHLAGWLGSAGLVCGIYLFLYIRPFPIQAVGTAWNGLSFPYPQNLLSIPAVYSKALLHLLKPLSLSVDYAVRPVQSFADYRLWAGLFIMAGLVNVVIFFRQKKPLVSLGAGIFLLGFLPTSNIIPLFNPFADRYLYVPAIGFSLLLATLILRTNYSVGQRINAVRYAVMIGLCGATLTLSFLRLQDFKSDHLLWESVLRAEPNSARAYVWLGLDYKADGDREKARQYFEKAHALNPRDVSSLVNLGILQGEDGHVDEAERFFRQALEIRNDKAAVYRNLAVVYQLRGQEQEMEEALKRSLELDPHRAGTAGRL